MPSILVLMGPQGAGKGTQAQMIAESFNLPIVATGDILRDIALTDTPLGHQVRETQAAGQLVSDDILAEVINSRLSQCDCEQGASLTVSEDAPAGETARKDRAQSRGHRIFVVKIDVPRELLLKRLEGRRTCTMCGAIYHVKYKPPVQEGVCDLDGHPLFTRSDDYPEAIENRLALYDEKTRPLLDYYGESNRLHKVDGTGTVEEVFNRIADAYRKELNSEGERKVMNDE